MSNYLAIATVTSAIQQMLREAVTEKVPGAEVTTLRPEDAAKGHSQKGVNLYLFQAIENLTVRENSPGDGVVANRSQFAMDLHYILTFFGKEERYEPEKLLALATIAFLESPILTNDRIAKTITGASGAGLAGSDLAAESQLVHLTVKKQTPDELQRVWGFFSPTPYRLSIVCVASVVILSGRDSSSAEAVPRAQGNRGNLIRLNDWTPKQLEATKGASITVSGDNMPPQTVVLLNDTPLPTQRSAGGVTAQLHQDFRAGTARVSLATDEGRTVVSETVTVQLRPSIVGSTRVTKTDHETLLSILSRPVPEGDQSLRLSLLPTEAGKGQNSSDVLWFPLPRNDWSPVGSVPDSLRRAFSQNGHPLPEDAEVVQLTSEQRIRSKTDPTAEFALRKNRDGLNAYFGLTSGDAEGVVTFAFSPIAKGNYALRLSTDGVESSITMDGDKIVGPLVEVSA